MSDPKTLKFQFVVDEASLQKTRQVIRELTTDLTKLNEAAGKFGGGSGGGGLGGVNIFGGGAKSPESQRVIAKTPPIGRQLVQGFLDQKQIFKNISDGSKDSMRVMTESLHRAIAAQKQDLKNLEQSAKSLVQTYDDLGDRINRFKTDPAARSRMGWARDASNTMSARQQAAVDLQQNLSDQQKARGQLESLEGMIEKPPAKQGFFGKLWQGGFLEQMGLGKLLKGPLGPLTGAAGVLTSMSSLSNEYMNTVNSPQRFRAEKNQLLAPAMGALAGGDLTYSLAFLRAAGTQNSIGIPGLSTTVNPLQAATGFGSAIGTSARGLMGAAVHIGSLGLAGKAGSFSLQGMDNEQMKKVMGIVDTFRAAESPLTGMALGGFTGDLGSRVQYQRLLGGGGFHRDPKTGKYVDAFGDLKASLQSQGYSPGEFMGSYSSLRSLGGSRFAGQMAYASMAAQAAGYGGFGELGAAGARAGAGTALAYGAIGGPIDHSAGIQLGQTIIGSGFDRMGTTSGLGLLSAVQQGGGFTGGVGDFNQVQRVGAGMGLLNGLTTGGLDPYQKGRNLVSAIDRLGPGASTYAQDFLGNGMNFRQMIDMAAGGKMTATASALGLTRGDIRGQLSDTVGSVFDRYVDNGGKDPMSKAIRAFRSSGKSLSGYLGGLKGDARTSAVSSLGAYYGIETGEGEEAGLGAMGVLAGMDSASINRITKRKGLGGKIGGAEKDELNALSKVQEQLNDTLKSLGRSVGDSAKASSILVHLMERESSNETGAAKGLTDSLIGLKASIDTLAQIEEGRFGQFQPRATPVPKATAPRTSQANINNGPGIPP